jgi:hypothetical protein
VGGLRRRQPRGAYSSTWAPSPGASGSCYIWGSSIGDLSPRTITEMGKTVQIHDVPDDVYATLQRRAADDYLREELAIVAGRTSMHELLTRAARRPGNLPFGEATRDIRAMRDGDRE